MTPRLRSSRLVLAVGIAAAFAPAALADAPFFTSVEGRAGLIAQEDPGVIRSRYVSFDLATLPKVGEEATFNLLPGFDSRVRIDRVEDAYAGGRVYVGHVVNETGHSEVIISLYSDAAVINVRDPIAGTFFEIKPAGAPGVFALNQIDEDILPGCGFLCDDNQLAAVRMGPQPRIEGGADGPGVTVIDLLVLFTPAAQSQAGGANGMTATLNSFVTTTNNAYTNSLVNQQIRLVHAVLTNYTEAAGMGTDLNRLSSNGDGFMDEAHSLRNTYGADLVHLVSGAANGACGIAGLGGNNQNIAFAVTARQCGSYTFAHELGHNMGCCHHPSDGGGCGTGGFFCYSAGWRSANNLWHDIMAYDPGTRIGYFSNPNITLELPLSSGLFYTIGQADPPGCSQPVPNYAADNTRTMNNTRTAISNYRPTQVGNPPPSTFSLITPANNAVGVAPAAVFNWQTATLATDYSLIVSPNADLSNPVFEDNVGVPGITLPAGFLPYTTFFYWTVTASNLGGQTPTSSGIFRFKVRPFGDISGNGVVDFADLNIVLGQFGQTGPLLPGDVNGDLVVNFADLNIILSNFGQS